jgi:hypothetical protein
MIQMLVLRLLLVVLICIAVLDVLERFDPTPSSLFVQADCPVCATVKSTPLLRTPSGRLDYRLGKPSNDRGDA